MSASGLPSNSSEVARRRMSARLRAPRYSSRKRLVFLFSELNSTSLMSSSVQEKIEARTRPAITTLTTGCAIMNMAIGVRPAPPWPAAASSAGAASSAAASAAGAAASAAGAAASAAGAEAAAGAAGAAASCARTGELAIRTAAPAIARRIFVFLLSSMFRQFLLWSDSWNPSPNRVSRLGLYREIFLPPEFLPRRSAPHSCETSGDALQTGAMEPYPPVHSLQARMRLSPFDERLSERQGRKIAFLPRTRASTSCAHKYCMSTP